MYWYYIILKCDFCFLDLVIDEEKFQNDGKDQSLPKKQKELLKRIQVQQKFVCISIYLINFILTQICNKSILTISNISIFNYKKTKYVHLLLLL